jgi:hypothetical protein
MAEVTGSSPVPPTIPAVAATKSLLTGFKLVWPLVAIRDRQPLIGQRIHSEVWAPVVSALVQPLSMLSLCCRSVPG